MLIGSWLEVVQFHLAPVVPEVRLSLHPDRHKEEHLGKISKDIACNYLQIFYKFENIYSCIIAKILHYLFQKRQYQ